jgi:activator of 2-hydroxyglutaryl-CoA dehydratase
VGTTGYAKDILKDVVGADAALVETVAHTEAGLHFYEDVDVICDVGGQDIKIIILKNGRVKDFKLNTQCSAGNGYFLQSTAQGFNVPVEEYADVAFGAKGFPSSATAARCSCRATSSISSARAGSRKRSWRACATCCPRTSGCTFRRFPTSPPSARASCCRAARSTTWPP